MIERILDIAARVCLIGSAVAALAVLIVLIFSGAAEAGHVFDETGNAQLDGTLKIYSEREGSGSVTIIQLYPNPDQPDSCQVDVITAYHVAQHGELLNDMQTFRLLAKDEKADLAIMRGKVMHPCASLAAAHLKAGGVPFATPIWTVGYPLGERAYAEGFAGECTIDNDGLDWCMHRISGGFGASGSGIYAGTDLIGLTQRGVGDAGPYVMGVAPWHIQDFLDEVYDEWHSMKKDK